MCMSVHVDMRSVVLLLTKATLNSFLNFTLLYSQPPVPPLTIATFSIFNRPLPFVQCMVSHILHDRCGGAGGPRWVRRWAWACGALHAVHNRCVTCKLHAIHLQCDYLNNICSQTTGRLPPPIPSPVPLGFATTRKVSALIIWCRVFYLIVRCFRFLVTITVSSTKDATVLCYGPNVNLFDCPSPPCNAYSPRLAIGWVIMWSYESWSQAPDHRSK